ncbi:unnamed protein product [Pseudo-nitzschia multistriata]|uniref:Uncharacterized protein n=1 Tax=Pseudo-nitzschia multistriata TaxID=183589 RepID=A0A448YYD0_9STRA|nr:unnamed protein product [Pseudo-nitzschia multistriata]
MEHGRPQCIDEMKRKSRILTKALVSPERWHLVIGRHQKDRHKPKEEIHHYDSSPVMQFLAQHLQAVR